MVSRRTREAEPVSSDYDEETEEPRGSQTSLFLTKLLIDVQKSQNQLQNAVANLKEAIERQEKKLDKFDEIRGDLRVYVTKLDRTCSDLADTNKKLDTVRTWVIGASSVLAALVIISQFALRFWPASGSPPIPVTITLAQPTGALPSGQSSSVPSTPTVPARRP